MSRLRERVEEHHVEILDIAARNNALDIKIFGSVAKGLDGDKSDVDFLVVMAEGSSLFDLGGIQFALSELLGVDVDVISEGSLKARDAHILDEAIPL